MKLSPSLFSVFYFYELDFSTPKKICFSVTLIWDSNPSITLHQSHDAPKTMSISTTSLILNSYLKQASSNRKYHSYVRSVIFLFFLRFRNSRSELRQGNGGGENQQNSHVALTSSASKLRSTILLLVVVESVESISLHIPLLCSNKIVQIPIFDGLLYTLCHCRKRETEPKSIRKDNVCNQKHDASNDT